MPRARLLTKCGKEHLCGSLEKLDWEKYILLNLHWFIHLSSRLTSLFRNSQKNIFFLKKLSSTLLLNYKKKWIATPCTGKAMKTQIMTREHYLDHCAPSMVVRLK